MSDAQAARPRGSADYRQTSFWLETTPDDLTPRPHPRGDLNVDVAILGGGFSGLWTAYYLLRENPSLEIAIVERHIVGYGASGRNGGWCSPRFPVDPKPLMKNFGPDRARRTILALQASVRDIGDVVEREAIDAHYVKGGLLSVAVGAHQLPSLQRTLDIYRQLGLGDGNRLLGPDEARERVAVKNLAGALRTEAGASIHPGNLVRGLARAVERLGGVIYEQTDVERVEGGDTPRLVTEHGTISARKGVVVAAEAYLPSLPKFRRHVLPMSSMIVLTEPLSQDIWDEIGWAGHESLSSQSHLKNYLTRTADGRILYGSRGALYTLGSTTPDVTAQSARFYEWMRESLREWFPVLEKARFSHAWGGYLGVPRDWLPTVAFDSDTKIGQLHGYTGRGVSTSHLAGKLLAGLITGKPTGLEDLPLHRDRTRFWEPEPLRWLGVRYVQTAFGRIDRAEQAGRKPPWDAPLAEYLGEQ
jgi:glycine/D-amino acid oxidase-like deaminating enzyme